MKTSFRTGSSTIGIMIEETCKSICKRLCADSLKLANTEKEWKVIADGFAKRYNMPNCIGAIDGKHIDIDAVPNSGSYYFNYKKRKSIILIELVDSNRKFIYVDIGCNGRVSDGGVLIIRHCTDILKIVIIP